MINPMHQTMHHTRASSIHPLRLVLFVRVFPRRSETFIVQKFLGTPGTGLGCAYCLQSMHSRRQASFSTVARMERTAQSRSCNPPGTDQIRGSFAIPLFIPAGSVACAKKQLAVSGRGWRHFGPYILHLFYLDAEFIVLNPALIHYEFSTLAYGHMYQKKLLDCRITVSFRGTDINTARLDQPDFYSQIWEQADALHLVSEDLWKQAQKQGCPSNKPHTVILPAIDTAFFTPGAVKQDESVGYPSTSIPHIECRSFGLG